MSHAENAAPPGLPWRRHHLDRKSSPPIEELVGTLAGIQTTYETTPPLSLAARVQDFEPDELKEALASGRLVWMSAMRGSKFVLPVSLVGAAVAAFAALAEELTWSGLRSMGMERAEVERSLDEVLRVLEDAGGPLTAAAVKSSVKGRHADGALYVLAARGVVMRAGRRGSYTLRSRWLSHAEHLPSFKEAMRLFVSSYLKAYGPVSTEDAVWWTGLPAPFVREALAAVGEVDAEGFWRTGDNDDSHPPADELRLLPALDPLTTGWLRRERLGSSDALKLVYTKQGTSRPAVLFGGRLAGIWEAGGKVELVPGARVPRTLLADELKRMRRALRVTNRSARR